MLHANMENAARAAAALRTSLYAQKERKHYKVVYCEKLVTGIDTWDAYAPKTERQTMDRPYGGSMEFLVTDVATGDRGEGIGQATDADAPRFTELSMLCDVNGLHIRYDAKDERARDIEAKLLPAGSYEGYIAPGANQPYICILVNIQSGDITFYNTTYDNLNHKRLNTSDSIKLL